MKKKTYTHTSLTRGKRELSLYKFRLNKVRLEWCKQVLEIIKKFKIKSLNDLGCNYFQLYKEIKIQNLKYNYFGYDIDKKFVEIGLKKFPELKRKYKICNIERQNLRKVDCTVASAVLEHVDKPNKFLEKILNSTKKIIIIRSQFGANNSKTKTKLGALKPVNFNQFSFSDFSSKIEKKNFSCFYFLDKATNYSLKFKRINKQTNSYRRIFIMVAIKNGS